MNRFFQTIFVTAILFFNSFAQSAINKLNYIPVPHSETFFNFTDSNYTKDYLDSLWESDIADSIKIDSVMHPFPRNKDEGSSTFPLAIGIVSFLYLFNPIILFENDKIALGFTKELSLGFGKFGQHRATIEYSYIFRKDLNSIIRLGYKYDMLMKKGIQPSNLLQGTPALTVGGGYFHNFSRPGYFVESSYGYSIRNDKVLFYPSLKLRYTYVVKGSNIFDFSFGLIIGIANPYIDLKIRRSKKNLRF